MVHGTSGPGRASVIAGVLCVLGLVMAGLTPAVAAPGARQSEPAVTLKTNALKVPAGDRLVLRGRTTADRGTRVLIQRRTGGESEFTTTHRTRVRSQGRIKHVERPAAAGRVYFRACVRVHHRNCSKPVRIQVTDVASGGSRWYYLHDQGVVTPAAGEWCERPETVAGVVYEKSVAFGAHCFDHSENYGEVALGGLCSRFEAVIGIADASTEDIRFDAYVRVDDAEVFAQRSLARGQAFGVAVDLTGAQRLRLEGPFVSGTLGNIVFGDARMWCDF
jgi:NPCBM/NEW2 domain